MGSQITASRTAASSSYLQWVIAVLGYQVGEVPAAAESFV
jgi:hypothetical protein